MPSRYEQQPDEPNLWFDRFTRYRLSGPTRSIRNTYHQEVARDMPATSEQVAKSSHPNAPHQWYDMSKEWRWKERAEEWDAEERQRLIEEDRVERDAFRRQFLKRERTVVNGLLEKAEQMLKFPVAEVKTQTVMGEDGRPLQVTTIMPADWRLRDLPYLVDVVNRVGRLSAGESTDNVQQVGVTLEDVIDALPAELGEQVREQLTLALSEEGGPEALTE